MSISAIERLSTLADIQKDSATTTGTAGNLPFQTIFEDAIQNVKNTDAQVNEETVKLSTGESDDLHNLIIASNKATLSVQLLVQLRDKSLDAYNELMRMSV